MLYPFVLFGDAVGFVESIILWQCDGRGSRLSRVQGAIAGLAVAGSVVPGVWLLASGNMRGENGLTVFIDLLIPVVLTLPFVLIGVSRRASYTASCALLLGIFCLFGGFSIGPLFLPAAAFLVLAGAVGLASPRRRS